jgi:RHS repeat-associated protein
MAFNVVFQNGELCYDDVDCELPGFIPIVFDRAYRSSRRWSGRQGHGWSWPWKIELRVTNNIYTFCIDSEIVTETFTQPGPSQGQYLSDSGARLTILDGWMTVNRVDGYTYYFSGSALTPAVLQVSFIDDAIGNRLTFDYTCGELANLTDADGRKYSFSYDGAGHVTGVDLLTGGSPNSPRRLVTYEYDWRGDLVRVINRLGCSKEYHYSNHLLVAFMNRSGGWFFAQYDESKRCVRHWRGDDRFLTNLRVDTKRHQVLMTDACGYSTLFRLDDNGKVIEEVQPNGARVASAYDEDGGLLASIDGAEGGTVLSIAVSSDNQAVTILDSTGSKIEQKIDLRNGQRQIIDASGGLWSEDYDERGLVIGERSPLGAVTTYQYDTKGALKALTRPNGNTLRFSYAEDHRHVEMTDDIGEHATLSWDEEGRLIEYRLAGGNPEKYYYDAEGLLTGVLQANNANVTLRRDAEGELVEIVDAMGATTKYEVTPYGEVLSEVDALGRQTRFGYDELGRLNRIQIADGEEMAFEYDSSGNIVRQKFLDARVEEYDYDVFGNLSRIRHADGVVVEYKYDSMGRIKTTSDPEGRHTVFSYDEQGRCLAADNDGIAVQFKYDPDGNCISEKQAGAILERDFDLNGNCIKLAVSGIGVRTYVYDLRNRLARVVDFDGTPFDFQYDLRDRCSSIQSQDFSVRYSYLPENRPGDAHFAVGEFATEIHYQYDGAGRTIERRTVGRPTVRYEYDPVGRLRRHIVGASTNEYSFTLSDDLARNSEGGFITYESGSNPDRSGLTQYEIDGRGRISARYNAEGESTTFAYDSYDQLVRIVSANTGSSRYVYDAFGRRVAKSVGNTEVKFVWDDEVLLAEISTARTESPRVHLIDRETAIPISTLHGGRRQYFLPDRNGYPLVVSTRDMVPLNDEPHPWGSTRLSPSDAKGQPFRFAGQYADIESGLHYNRYRYYDPLIGHFLTPDPIGINGGMNIYSYMPDPVNLIDINGLAATIVKSSPCKKGKKKAKKSPPKTQTAPCNPSRGSSIHNDCLNKLRDKADAAGYDTRADQTMMSGNGNNRPDLFISGMGKSIYVEFDYSPASRAAGHKKDICKAHPGATVYLVKIPQSTRFRLNTMGKKPKKPGSIARSTGPSDADCGIDKISI